MVELTVANVSALIAAGVFIARLWSPNYITLIIAGILGDRNSASTWSLSGRVFQQSLWPDILNTDSARTHGARSDITNLSRLSTAMALLISIAGVVTPLGLYDALVPGKPEPAPFQYMADGSPFGYGTPPRSDLPFSRICSSAFSYEACPFSNTVVDITTNDSMWSISIPYNYNSSIPDIVSDIYSSGTKNRTTVSNFFDIQWRRYATQVDPEKVIDNGTAYLLGAFRPLQSVILNNAIEPVEGLIVDSMNGGIGFRNHTVPPGFPLGVSWTEDLLFIEPETVCVDTNLTLDFTISLSQNSSVFVDNLVLTDRGGFVNLNHTYPQPNQTDPQSDAQLWDRAYKAALVSNAYTMFFYNVSNPRNETEGTHSFAYVNSHLGKTFPLQSLGSAASSSYDALSIDTTFSNYFYQILNNTNSAFGVPDVTQPNPFNVNASWFDDISTVCEHYYGDIDTNINNVLMSCGYMYGVPQRRDGGSSRVFDSGSKWSKPLYICATATKAIIKTATLNYNGTRGLQSLTITELGNKTYPSQAELPLWGVEDVGNLSSTSSSPVWGLISADNEHRKNVSSVRQESLYLPGRQSAFAKMATQQDDNLPGANLAKAAMNGAYSVGYFADSSSSGGPKVDYSGDTQMAMWSRWQTLSESAGTASKIVNLIWTDYAASAVVGTKGVLGPGNTATAKDAAAPINVVPFSRRVQYHLPYAIPAIITAVFLLLISIAALVICCMYRVSLNTLRKQMNRACSGRILTTFLHPGECEIDTASREWSEKMAKTTVELPHRTMTGTELDYISKPESVPTGKVQSKPVDDIFAEQSELLAESHAQNARKV